MKWMLLNTTALCRKPEDEGASSSGGEGSDSGGDNAGQDGGDNSGEGGESNSSSILDFASKSGGEGESKDGEAGEWKLPDGMELPDHLVGTDASQTLEKVAKAYSGARRELSQRGKAEGVLEGVVPDKPDGYEFEDTGTDDKPDVIFAELTSETSKPIVDAFKAAAQKNGIPDKAFAAFMRDGMAGVAEAGIPLGQSNEEAAKVSGEAEFEALTKEVGVKEAGTMINTIDTYKNKLVERGVLQSDDEQAEFDQMMGTAMASRIFYRIMTGEFGEAPIPPADGADGSVSPEEAQASYAAASKMPEGAEKNAAMAAAQEKMTKAFGTNNAGSVRSSIL